MCLYVISYSILASLSFTPCEMGRNGETTCNGLNSNGLGRLSQDVFHLWGFFTARDCGSPTCRSAPWCRARRRSW